MLGPSSARLAVSLNPDAAGKQVTHVTGCVELSFEGLDDQIPVSLHRVSVVNKLRQTPQLILSEKRRCFALVA